MVYFIYPSRFQGHLKYFQSIVVKLCTTDHQSCQEPETLSVGHFFQKKLLDLCEMSQIDSSLFEYLDSVNCNQLWQLFDKKRYNFLSKRDRKKKRYLVGMKFCCACNAAIKKVKIARKKIDFFLKIFSTKLPFLLINTDF